MGTAGDPRMPWRKPLILPTLAQDGPGLEGIYFWTGCWGGAGGGQGWKVLSKDVRLRPRCHHLGTRLRSVLNRSCRP